MERIAEHGISGKTLALLRKMQRNEATEGEIYRKIANRTKDEKNRSVLLRLSQEEKAHYELWKSYTGEEMKPRKSKVWLTVLSAIVFGFTFTVKRMEHGETIAQAEYALLEQEVADAKEVEKQENAHESALLEMLDEERLKYVGSMVLGLNDALVELTGTLAGLTLAMRNTRIIALSGLITGIAATLSMAASEFLSAKSEGRPDALKSCTYTGIAYLITVVLLILPYLLFSPPAYLFALATMLLLVILILVIFNYYIAVAKDISFRKRFLQMASISMGVAALSFLVGLLVKNVLGVDA